MFDSYSSVDAIRNAHRSTARGTDAPITVFVNRRGFTGGVSRMLARGAGQCAVLQVTLRGSDASTGSVSRKLLNLAGNTLRAALLEQAAAASELAWGKPSCKLHMLRGLEAGMRPLQHSTANLAAYAA